MEVNLNADLKAVYRRLSDSHRVRRWMAIEGASAPFNPEMITRIKLSKRRHVVPIKLDKKRTTA